MITLTPTETAMLELAKRFLSINEWASLTGTLMLKVRGINIGREAHDIDILLRDYAQNVIIPEGLTFIEKTGGSGMNHRVLDFDGILVDILSDGEQPEIVDGLQLGTLAGLMSAKLGFILNNTDVNGKHRNDLVKLGFDFDAYNKEIQNDLPF